MNEAQLEAWMAEMQARASGTYIATPKSAQKPKPTTMSEHKRELVDQELAHLRAIRLARYGV